MKRHLLLITCSLTSLLLNAQSLLNGGFENWTITNLYDNPDSLTSTNGWVYPSTGSGNVVRVSPGFHLNYAVQMTTVATPNDTMFGGLILGTPIPNGIAGGIPFTGQPDSVSAYVKYNIQPGDTGWFIIGFKNAGNIIAFAVKTFTGTQGTYQRFSVPTNLPVSPVPDSLVAIISSSRLDPPRQPGSTLTLDSITMINSTQGFPNPSFENWTNISIEEPDNWSTINDASIQPGPYSATKNTSSYSGNYAMRLETVGATFNDTAGYITNGYFGNNGPAGGLQVWGNPWKVTGYYKYFPVGSDTAWAGAFTSYNTIGVETVFIPLTNQNSYTYFEIPLTYNSFPTVDTINIAFSSSNITSGSFNGLGSALYLDELGIIYYPLSETEHSILLESNIYPNPFHDNGILYINAEPGARFSFLIYDAAGRLVMRDDNIHSGNNMIHKEGLADGLYEYSVIGSNGTTVVSHGKLVVQN